MDSQISSKNNPLNYVIWLVNSIGWQSVFTVMIIIYKSLNICPRVFSFCISSDEMEDLLPLILNL